MGYKRIAGITIELDADTTKLVRSLDKVSKTVGNIGDKISDIGGSLTRNITVPLAAAAGAAVSKYADVDKTMTLANKTMGNTVDEADALNQAMQEAASNSTFGMTDAANASLNFARAGLKAEDAAAALAPAMNLAAGEGGELDVVSAGLVATINGFGDSFGSAEKYADVFANACNNSALDVNSLSDSMSIAAPIFNAAGYSVEDAALYMGVMANAGIDAGEAANSLKTGMARLISPAKDGAEWLERLGIEVTNADGSMKDSLTIQKDLHDAFSGLSESEQIAAASAIFGKNQMSKWLALINTAPADVEDLSEKLEKEGTAQEMADEMMNGFGGSIEKLKSTLDVLMTSLGELMSKYLTPMIEKIQGVIDKFNSLDDEQKDHIIKIAGIIAAVGPALLILGKVITVVSTIISVASGLAAVLPLLAGPFGIVLAAIAAIVAIGIALYKNWDTIKEKAGELKDWVSEKWTGLKDKIAETDIGKGMSMMWDAAKKTAVNAMTDIRAAYDEHGGGLEGAVYASMETVKQWFTAGWNFVDNLTGGKLTAIKDTAMEKISAMKEVYSAGFTAIKDTAKETMSAMTKAYEEHGGGMEGIAAATAAGIQNVWKKGFDAINKLTGGKAGEIAQSWADKFTNMKDKITGIFDVIKQKIKSAIDFIKNLFNFEFRWPDLKLPHFSIVGGFSLNPPSVPQLSVSWYKKAMSGAYMLDDATIFGARGNTLLGGGEAGHEMIIGTNKLMEMIAQAKGGDTVITNTFQINGSNRDPQELAQEISFYLDMELQRTERAFG